LIYLCAGVYAEGPTDHRFLKALLPRLLEELAAQETKSYEVAAPLQIGTISTPRITIVEAIRKFWESCTLFIIHADAAGDREGALQKYVTPHIDEARNLYPSLIAVPCIPDREIEAWMLCDEDVFSQWSRDWRPELPREPEKVLDPKKELEKILATKKQSVRESYELFGEYISIARLRRLNSFCLFEDDLKRAIHTL
jgi:hypothetical protein